MEDTINTKNERGAGGRTGRRLQVAVATACDLLAIQNMAYTDPIKFSNYKVDPGAGMSGQLQNRKTRNNTQENFRRRKINLIRM